MSIVHKTQSVCPHCLRVLDAAYVSQEVEQKKWTFLQKRCPEHGDFSSPIWVDLPNTPSFEQWYTVNFPQYAEKPITQVRQGCPFDCGLCPEHAQSTCCALLEVTQRCNMQCPVCYASTKNTAASDPSFEHMEASLDALMRSAGAVNVQISGGEPTVRHDLEHIIALIKRKGFHFVQLNTNGLRLGEEADYAQKLKNAGLNLIYLQWDDVADATYELLRGRPCVKVKEKALQHCIEAGLAVVLVVTVVKGVNDTALGAIVQRALEGGSLVRGVHLQPVSSFGRVPWSGNEAPRITIPQVLFALEEQSKGMIKARDFQQPQSEHALCSFNAVYERCSQGLMQVSQGGGGCCASVKPAKRAQEFVAAHWNAPPSLSTSFDTSCTSCHSDFDKALEKMQHRFTLSGMAFQDAYTLDLERLRRCHIHILSNEHTIVPFCAYNLTSHEGFALYRKEKNI